MVPAASLSQSFAPAVAVDHGSERQRGIRGAARDHDVGSGGECFGQRERADVGVGALDAIANRRDRLAGIHIGQLVALGEEFVDAPENIVTQHRRDL